MEAVLVEALEEFGFVGHEPDDELVLGFDVEVDRGVLEVQGHFFGAESEVDGGVFSSSGSRAPARAWRTVCSASSALTPRSAVVKIKKNVRMRVIQLKSGGGDKFTQARGVTIANDIP